MSVAPVMTVKVKDLPLVTPRRALLSVSDKTGLLDFAKGLVARGVELISTGGTSKSLADAGIPVINISDVTKFSEILDGRVKTLHPVIHAGILADRLKPEHVETLTAHGIGAIDLVVVNLYPFRETVAKPGATLAMAIENIDIGGPTMVRAAAKNFGSVAVVVEPSQYQAVLNGMDAGGLSGELRFDLARQAFSHTAAYDSAVSEYLLVRTPDGEGVIEEPAPRRHLTWELVQSCRYGENPHQKAAFYRPAGQPAALAALKQLQGKELSFNNLLDADAALRVALELSPIPTRPGAKGAVIIKHTNPCGAALSDESLSQAFRTAFDVDSTSAFGGIVGLTHEVDEAAAEAMKEIFLEAIIAPKFSEAALAVLGKKKNLRLLEIDMEAARQATNEDIKRVAGGYLVQQADNALVSPRDGKVVTARAPTDAEYAALELAWRLVKHVKSNAIVYSFADRMAAAGAGQTSRVDSSKIAVSKAGPGKLVGSVIASDAFFPFRDGVDAAAAAGVTAVVQPGGSVRDDEVIAAANEHNLAMVFTGMRHFRH
jgi:phosphoribosylaminoimidazolecarboxamide formyltransferase / IMP cyclohydrolase